jgi:hypothetical protein
MVLRRGEVRVVLLLLVRKRVGGQARSVTMLREAGNGLLEWTSLLVMRIEGLLLRRYSIIAHRLRSGTNGIQLGPDLPWFLSLE